MGRKRKDNGGSIALLIITAIAFIAPIVLIVGYFYNKYKFNEIKNHINGNKYDFWLTDKEKDDYKSVALEYIDVKDKVDKANQNGIDKNLSRNNNGEFSAKSNLGREIQHTLKQYTPRMRLLKNDISYFSNLPRNRWIEFNTYLQRTYAFAWTSITFMCTFGLLQILSQGVSLMRSLIISLIAAIISYALTIKLTNNFSQNYTPIPEEVNFTNIDFDKIEQNTKNTNHESKFLSKKLDIVLIFFVIFYSYNVFLNKSDKSETQTTTITSAQPISYDATETTALESKTVDGSTSPTPAILTPEKLDSFNAADIANLAPETVGGLTPAALASLDSIQLAALTPEQLANVTAAQVGALSPAQITALGIDIAAFPQVALASFNAAQGAVITPAQLDKFDVADIDVLSPEAVSGLMPTALASLDNEQLTALASEQIRVITAEQIDAMSPAQIFALGTELSSLSVKAMASIDEAQATTITSEQLISFDEKDIAALKPKAIYGLAPTVLSNLSDAQRAALTPEQVEAISLRHN